MSKQFEWTYTQFVSENVFLNIILHKTDMFGNNSLPYLSVSYYTKNRDSAHHRFSVSSGDVFCKNGSDETLVVDIEKADIKIVGQIHTKQVNKFNQNLYARDKDSFSAWNVIIPHGFFAGIIQIKGVPLAGSAVVYQDKQYGSLPIQNFLDRWGWSVVVCDHVTRGLFSVLSTDGHAVTIHFSSDGTSFSSSIENLFDSLWVDSLNIRTPNLNVSKDLLGIEFDHQHPIRQREFEKHDNFSMSYYRYPCTRDGLICGACEYMKIHTENAILWTLE